MHGTTVEVCYLKSYLKATSRSETTSSSALRRVGMTSTCAGSSRKGELKLSSFLHSRAKLASTPEEYENMFAKDSVPV